MKSQVLKHKKLVLIIILILLVAGVYLYFQQKQGNVLLPSNSNTEVQQKALIDKVGDLILLPANEAPQIATVSDKSKLPPDPFFANAQNGDKVLIYNIAGEAIIYRPSINKIINVAPINTISNTQAPVNASASATPVLESPTP